MSQQNELRLTSLEDVRPLKKNTALEALGAEIEAIDDEQVIITMPITNAARQPLGQLHGGVSMVLAESAASLHAAWGINLAEVAPVGIEINGSHLRAASEGTVRAVGKLVRRSRSLAVHQIDIFHVETGNLLSTARVTNFYKQMKSK